MRFRRHFLLRKRPRTSGCKREKGSRGVILAISICIALLHPAKAEMAVTVVRAASHCFADRILASGVFVARHLVEVRADRDGLLVSERLVEMGDVVAKDQVLARLVSAKAPTQEPVVVKAPVAGTLVGENATVGAYVSPESGDPLFRIAEGGEVELRAETRAASLSRLREGMTARLHVIGLGDIDGRIASIGEGVDARTQLGTLRVSVAVDPRLRVGAFARTAIDVGQDCGLEVPLSAVLFGRDGAVVATVQSDRVIMRRVTTGLIDGGNIEIRDGLLKDDVVVARAAAFLRDGDPVHPVPSAP